MREKKNHHLTMQLYLNLLVMIELVVAVLIAWLGTDLLHRYFQITVEIPDLLLLLLFSTVISGAITLFLGKWFFNPILKLRKAMRQVAEGNFDIRLEEKHRFQEIREIYVDFNRMASELGATEILQTDFVSNVSHEFKTPINAIEGYATLLQGSSTSDGEEQKQYVDKILFNTRRLSNLVGNILLLSKADNQSILAKQSAFRLDEQIRQSIVLLEPEWDRKEIEFDVELDRITYTGNEALLLHVWNNLIGNAIKFNPTGGRIWMQLKKAGTGVKFTIEDSGPGISEEVRKHVFDRFYQGDSSHKEEGNGLGLALVKQIVEGSHGTVRADNIPAGGCRFVVTLPVKEI